MTVNLSFSQWSGKISLHSIYGGTFQQIYTQQHHQGNTMILERWIETNQSLSKCKEMDLDSSSTLSMLLCVEETPFNREQFHSLHSISDFPISCFAFQRPYNSRESVTCLDNASFSMTHTNVLLAQKTHHLLALCFTP